MVVSANTRADEDARRELLRRARARESLHSYVLNIDVPMSPFDAMEPDEDLTGPARDILPKHQTVMLDVLQRTVTRPFGRCMIFAPPGTMKSLNTSVVMPTWVMGRTPKTRIILTSYGGKIAERQARRGIQICKSEKYRMLWPEQPQVNKEEFIEPTVVRDAAGDWSLSNGSEMIALGITGGVTGNRANGLIVDDPIAGREEADSETMRQKVRDAYEDDCKSRLLEGAWIAFIMTRWHENDLAGSILPDDYKGESGHILCKDGMVWEILNLEAKCERADDPLGREFGEYIFPEYYSVRHWQQYELATGTEATRRWSSLYQQRPAPQGSGRFDESMIDFYAEGTQPVHLAYIGGGDYAVTEGKNDFTELGMFGVDWQGDLWEVDWWSKQSNTFQSAEATLDMIARWRPSMWFNEGGVIDKSMGPLINLMMRERAKTPDGYRCIADRRAIPSMNDKVAKCSSFQGRCAAGGERLDGSGKFYKGKVHFRDNPNSRRVVAQLVALPAGRYDDAADVCGLIGRAIDQFPVAHVPKPETKTGLVPFSIAWLEYQEKQDHAIRYR